MSQYGYAPTIDQPYANYATRLEPVHRRRENNIVTLIAFLLGAIVVIFGIVFRYTTILKTTSQSRMKIPTPVTQEHHSP